MRSFVVYYGINGSWCQCRMEYGFRSYEEYFRRLRQNRFFMLKSNQNRNALFAAKYDRRICYGSNHFYRDSGYR